MGNHEPAKRSLISQREIGIIISFWFDIPGSSLRSLLFGKKD